MKNLDKAKVMNNVAIGDIVEVIGQEGISLVHYQLRVSDVQICQIDCEVIAYGKGVTVLDEILANVFTDRIDSSNFHRVVSVNKDVKKSTIKSDIIVIEEGMEDKYKITVSCDGVNVLIENLTICQSVAINMFKFQDTEDDSIKNNFYNRNFEEFILKLIECGYLE